MATDQMRSKVAAAYAAWDAAFGTGDARKVAACYTDDALLLPPSHEVMDGPAGVEKFFGGLFANGVTGHKLELVRGDRGRRRRDDRRRRQMVGAGQGRERCPRHLRRHRAPTCSSSRPTAA